MFRKLSALLDHTTTTSDQQQRTAENCPRLSLPAADNTDDAWDPAPDFPEWLPPEEATAFVGVPGEWV